MQIDDRLQIYAQDLANGLRSVDPLALDRAATLLIITMLAKGTIFVCGNGGSAAISDHFLCDHSKGIYNDTKFFPKIVSLPSNMSLLTAIGNDISYDSVFSYQLDMFADPGDVLVVISSSGNSPNILSALRTAKASNMKTIALVGFDGGEAKDLADIVLHVPVNNYGIVEDAHQAIMHVIAQHIRITNKDKDTIKL
jgi:phosphoheptose isomerase